MARHQRHRFCKWQPIAVHAHRNLTSRGTKVVSLKLCYETEEDALQRLNDKLPPAIVAVGFRRVTAGFDARKQCDRCCRISTSPIRSSSI